MHVNGGTCTSRHHWADRNRVSSEESRHMKSEDGRAHQNYPHQGDDLREAHDRARGLMTGKEIQVDKALNVWM